MGRAWPAAARRRGSFAECKSYAGRGVEAFVRVNNVLDERYETFGTFAVNGREAGSPVQRFLTPALPLNVLAGLRYAF